jgi:apolipoprotein N-acyltransferase
MTALAMVIGMLPMSMSNTQNAPLGRAVIGGLLVATFATLLFVPCVFALLHQKRSTERRSAHEAPYVAEVLVCRWCSREHSSRTAES